MYMEASGPSHKGSNAMMETLPFVSSGMCLNFLRFMEGKDIGRLNIYQMIDGNVSVLLTLDSTRVASGWVAENVRLIDTMNETTVIFEAVRACGTEGDIAIDEVDISTQACNNSMYSILF